MKTRRSKAIRTLHLHVSFAAAFFVLGSAFAGEFTPAANNSAKVWNKYPNAKRRIEWRGTLDSEGFAAGRGVALFKKGNDIAAAYFGTMRRGKMDGHVVAIYPLTGMCYVGQIADWSEHGSGSMRFPDGSRYEGRWQNGTRNGSGTQWDPGGDVAYQGLFADDQPVPQLRVFERPSFLISDGGLVQKKFQSVKIRWFGQKDDSALASGFGVAVSSGEQGIAGIYHGLATRGRLDTNVVAIYANEDARMAYVGEISDWNENGYGQMFYPDGTTYIGHWKDEKRHGEGIVFSGTGHEDQRGWFEAGLLVKRYEPPSNRIAKADRIAEVEQDTHRYDELPSPRPTSFLSSQQQAITNILATIVAQWGLDWMVDADNSWGGAFISLVSRYYARPTIIDRNLRILLPDTPEPGIRFARTMICSIGDGTLSGEDLFQRTVKTEATVFAREYGTTEGEAVRLFFFLNDFSNRVQQIEKEKKNRE